MYNLYFYVTLRVNKDRIKQNYSTFGCYLYFHLVNIRKKDCKVQKLVHKLFLSTAWFHSSFSITFHMES